MTLRFAGHTVRSLLAALKELGDTPVERLHTAHSYRGDYADVAFEIGTDKVPSSEVRATVAAVLGVEFEGYKGGQFRFDHYTAVWAATYGTADHSGPLGGPTADGQWVVVEIA
jgi:hypothetical protein